MRQPSFGWKSMPSSRPSSDAAGPSLSLPAGYASSWCTQNRKGSSVGHWNARGTVAMIGESAIDEHGGAADAPAQSGQTDNRLLLVWLVIDDPETERR